jgi:hypothetical protein
MSTTPTSPVRTFEELRALSRKARLASAKAKVAKRNHRLYLQLADALDDITGEHAVITGTLFGLVGQLSDRLSEDPDHA